MGEHLARTTRNTTHVAQFILRWNEDSGEQMIIEVHDINMKPCSRCSNYVWIVIKYCGKKCLLVEMYFYGACALLLAT